MSSHPYRISRHSYASLRALKDDKKRYESKLKAELDLKPLHEQYTEKSYMATDNNGDMRLEALIETLNLLDTVGFKRSASQRKFHQQYIMACLKKIYGKDLARNMEKILKRWGLDEIRSDVIICTPRRWGKTFSVALFVAAYIWSQPGCEVSIYSTGRRASRKLLFLIQRMIVAIAGNESCIKTFNVEVLEVVGKFGIPSKCCSYPSKVQISLRAVFFLSRHPKAHPSKQKKTARLFHLHQFLQHLLFVFD